MSIENILKNKNCLLTGAAGSLGSELAKLLAKSGCNLFITSKNNEGLIRLQNYLLSNNNDISVYALSGDLTNYGFLEKLTKKVNDSFNSIDILINNAGVLLVNPISKSTISDFDYCFNLNVRAPFFLIKQFSKNMKKNNWGRIINIGSSSSYSGYPNTSLYCSTKHALLGLSRSISKELRDFNIRVYLIAPGSIKSKIGRKVKWENYEKFLEPKEVAEIIVDIISYNKQMMIDELRLNRMHY